MTRRRIVTLILAVSVALIPLMGAKGCGTAPLRRANIPVSARAGYPVRSGGQLYWIGRLPPKPIVGTEWRPGGFTKRNHVPIWVRVRK